MKHFLKFCSTVSTASICRRRSDQSARLHETTTESRYAPHEMLEALNLNSPVQFKRSSYSIFSILREHICQLSRFQQTDGKNTQSVTSCGFACDVPPTDAWLGTSNSGACTTSLGIASSSNTTVAARSLSPNPSCRPLIQLSRLCARSRPPAAPARCRFPYTAHDLRPLPTAHHGPARSLPRSRAHCRPQCSPGHILTGYKGTGRRTPSDD